MGATTQYIYKLEIQGEQAVKDARKFREQLATALTPTGGQIKLLSEAYAGIIDVSLAQMEKTLALRLKNMEKQWSRYETSLKGIAKGQEQLAISTEAMAQRMVQANARVVDSAQWMYDQLVGHSLYRDLQEGVQEAYDNMTAAASRYWAGFTGSMMSAARSSKAIQDQMLAEWKASVVEYASIYAGIAELGVTQQRPTVRNLGYGATGIIQMQEPYVERRDIQLATRVLDAAEKLITQTAAGGLVGKWIGPTVSAGMGRTFLESIVGKPGLDAMIASGEWSPAAKTAYVGVLDRFGETVNDLEVLRTTVHEFAHGFETLARVVSPETLRELYDFTIKSGGGVPPTTISHGYAGQLSEVLVEAIEAAGSRTLGIPAETGWEKAFGDPDRPGSIYTVGQDYVRQLQVVLPQVTDRLERILEGYTPESFNRAYEQLLRRTAGPLGIGLRGETQAEEITRALVPMVQLYRGVGTTTGEARLRPPGAYWSADPAFALSFPQEPEYEPARGFLPASMQAELFAAPGYRQPGQWSNALLSAQLPTSVAGPYMDEAFEFFFESIIDRVERAWVAEIDQETGEMPAAAQAQLHNMLMKEIWLELPLSVQAALTNVRQLSLEEIKALPGIPFRSESFADTDRYGNVQWRQIAGPGGPLPSREVLALPAVAGGITGWNKPIWPALGGGAGGPLGGGPLALPQWSRATEGNISRLMDAVLAIGPPAQTAAQKVNLLAASMLSVTPTVTRATVATKAAVATQQNVVIPQLLAAQAMPQVTSRAAYTQIPAEAAAYWQGQAQAASARGTVPPGSAMPPGGPPPTLDAEQQWVLDGYARWKASGGQSRYTGGGGAGGVGGGMGTTGTGGVWQQPIMQLGPAQELAPDPGAWKRWDQLGDAVNEATMKFFGLRRIGYSLESVGRAFDFFGQKVLGALTSAAQGYLAFDDASTRAAAAMELEKGLHGELQDAILEQAMALGMFAPEEMAEGMRLWVAGTGEVITSQEQMQVALERTISVQQLAYMNNVDLGETVNSVGGIIKEFGMDIDQTNEVVEVLNFVAARTYANVNDLGQAFIMVGPVARAMGDDFETVAAAMALLSDENLKGSKVGRALRQMYIQLLDPTKEHVNIMNQVLAPWLELNETWEDVVFPKGEFIGMAKYIDLLAAATENMTDQERNSLFAIIATANELPTLISLVGQQIEMRKEGVNVLSAYTDLMDENITTEVRAYASLVEILTGIPVELKGAAGVWETQLGIIESSDARRAARIQQRWNAVTISMGKAVTDVALPQLEKITDLLFETTELMERYPFLKTTIASAGLLLGLLASTAGKLTIFGGQIAGVLANYAIFTKALEIYSGASALHVKAMEAHTAALLKSAGVVPITKPPILPAVPILGPTALLVAAAVATGTLGYAMTQHAKYMATLTEEEQKAYYARMNSQRGLIGGLNVEAMAIAEEGVVMVEAGQAHKNFTKDVEDTTKALVAATVTGDLLRDKVERGGLYPTLPAWQMISEEDVAIVDRYQKLQDDLVVLDKDGTAQRKAINDDFNEYIEKGDKDLARSLAKTRAEFDYQTLRRVEQLNVKIEDARKETQERIAELDAEWTEKSIELRQDGLDEMAEAEEDFQKEMERMWLDHVWAMEDFILERDVLGALREMRSYARNKREAQEDHDDAMQDKKDQQDEAYTKAEEAYKKQRQQLQDSLDDQIEDMKLSFTRAEEERELDRKHQAELAIAEWEHQKEQKKIQRDADLIALTDSLALEATALETAAANELLILMNKIDDREEYLRKHYEQLQTDLNNFLFGPEGFVMAWTTAEEDIAKACLASEQEIADMGELLNDFPDWWGDYMTAQKRANQPENATKQAGGYASYGRYWLGEAGREFVLSAPTTRAFEQQLGPLSQTKLLAPLGRQAPSGGVGFVVDVNQQGWLFQGSFTEADKLWFADVAREKAMEGVLEVVRRIEV